MKLIQPILVALALSSGMAYAQTCEEAVNKDDKSAIAICEQALSQNPQDVSTQFFAGIAYDKAQNFEKAAELWTKAAEQGHEKAQYNLGTMYYAGQGVKRDYAKAVELYTKAANQGNPEAQFNLATMYRKGEGVTKDKAIAKEWFGKSCDGGIKDACSRR